MVRDPVAESRAVFSARVIEVGWLVALLATPVLFNVYSARASDNSAIARGAAVLILAAAGLRWLWIGMPRRWCGPRWPLALAALALGVSPLLSALLGVSPGLSWWGSDDQGQGALSQLAYLVLFCAVALGVRNGAQVRRLVDTVVFASLPVSLYSLVQRLGIDPIQWSAGSGQRGASTLGNADFLGGWLALVLPVTTYAALEAWRAWRRDGRGSPRSGPRLWVCAAALALQLLALQYSASRGAIVGLVAAALVCGVVLALAWLPRGWLAGMGALALAGVVALAVSGVPGRLLAANGPSGSFSARSRTLIWQAAVGLLGPHPSLAESLGRRDGLGWARPLVGYGPASASDALRRFVPAIIERYDGPTTVVNRAHNLVFDQLIGSGALGLAAWLAVVAGVAFLGLGVLWPGWRPRPGWFGGTVAAGLALGGLAGWAVGTLWIGLLLGVGFVAGLGGCLVVAAALARRERRGPPVGLALALLAALLAHVLGTQFEFEVNVTSAYFWMLAGLLVALSRQPLAARAEGDDSPALALPLLCGMGVCLTFDFVRQVGGAHDLPQAVWVSLTTVPIGGHNVSYGLAALVAASWLGGIALWGTSSRQVSVLVLAPAAVWLGFAGSYLWLLNRHSREGLTAANLLAAGMNRGAAFVWLTACLAAVALALAAALAWEGPVGAGALARLRRARATAGPSAGSRSSRERAAAGPFARALRWRGHGAAPLPGPWMPVTRRVALGAAAWTLPSWRTGWRAAATAGVVIGGLVAVALVAVRPVQAQMLLAVATSDFTGQVRLPAERQASELAPYLEEARLAVSGAALAAPDAPALLPEAEREIQVAARLRPLDPAVDVELAEVARTRQGAATDPAERSRWQAEVDRELGAAVALEPSRPFRWKDWAVEAARRQDYPLAFSRLEQALALDGRYTDGWAAFDKVFDDGSAGPATEARQLRLAIDLEDYEGETRRLATDDPRRNARLLMAASVHEAVHDDVGAFARRREATARAGDA